MFTIKLVGISTKAKSLLTTEKACHHSNLKGKKPCYFAICQNRNTVTKPMRKMLLDTEHFLPSPQSTSNLGLSHCFVLEALLVISSECMSTEEAVVESIALVFDMFRISGVLVGLNLKPYCLVVSDSYYSLLADSLEINCLTCSVMFVFQV